MNRLIPLIFALLFSVSAFAQGRGNRMNVEQHYRTQKIAFITDKMQLSPEEAQKFWPLYRELEEKKSELAHQMHEYRATFPADENELTEEQAHQILDFYNKHSLDMLGLQQEYQKKFLEVIPAKKMLMLSTAENEFRRHLLREFRGRNGNRWQN